MSATRVEQVLTIPPILETSTHTLSARETYNPLRIVIEAYPATGQCPICKIGLSMSKSSSQKHSKDLSRLTAHIYFTSFAVPSSCWKVKGAVLDVILRSTRIIEWVPCAAIRVIPSPSKAHQRAQYCLHSERLPSSGQIHHKSHSLFLLNQLISWHKVLSMPRRIL